MTHEALKRVLHAQPVFSDTKGSRISNNFLETTLTDALKLRLQTLCNRSEYTSGRIIPGVKAGLG